MVGELMEMMNDECKDGAMKEHCSSSKMAGELMEVMNGECGDGAEKKHWSNSKMVVELMEVVNNGECGDVLGLERKRSFVTEARWWVS
jgi:hypothetical protein